MLPASKPVDVLIAGLCLSIEQQRAQIVALEALAASRGDDCESLRLVCQQTMTALHDLQEAYGRLDERYTRILAEYREYREASGC